MDTDEMTHAEWVAEGLRRATGAYVIYSWDSPRSVLAYSGGAETWRPSVARDKWVETEGDEQWDYDYLSHEGDQRAKRELEALDRLESMIEDYDGHIAQAIIDRILDERPFFRGHHRKWVAELDGDEVREFIRDDLGLGDDWDEVGEGAIQTLGSLTEYGLIPAFALDASDGYCLDAQAYISLLVADPTA